MVAVNSKSLGVFGAERFIKSVSGADRANLFLTIGKCNSWVSDSDPPQANSATVTYYDVWNNMIGGKRITGNDVRHAIPRIDWSSGEVYNQYEDRVDSLTLNSTSYRFYVVTDQWKVYKCISNNYGALSTSKPTATTTVADFQTADGYVWKFMYEITSEEQERFVTNTFIPVKTILTNDASLQWQVQNNSIQGAIHNILVTNSGNNFVSNDVTVVISGDGSDANAFVTLNTTSQKIKSIVVDDLGRGYTYGNVSFLSANGSNAVGRVIISPGTGHGSDPVTELGGSYVMINIRLQNRESGKLSIANEFRQTSIIQNPLSFGQTTSFGNTLFNQLLSVTLTGTSNEYQEDEYVYQGSSLSKATFKGIVCEWDSPNNVIKLSNTEGTIGSDLLIGASTTAARFVSSSTNYELEKYTGKLLYINNIQPVQRASDQTEEFKIVLSF